MDRVTTTGASVHPIGDGRSSLDPTRRARASGDEGDRTDTSDKKFLGEPAGADGWRDGTMSSRGHASPNKAYLAQCVAEQSIFGVMAP